MTDIAELGFKAETSSLDKASASLSKLKAASAGVSTATNKVSTTVAASGLAVARAKTAEANAILKALQATKNANNADIEKAASALKVARAEEAKAKSVRAAAAANDQLTKSTLKVISAEKRQGSTRRDVVAAGGVAIDAMPNRFNTANVAAQFQDIGVTAAMGMNPMTIALQQGTQLSAILNTMKNPLQGLKVALMSVFNAVSLGTIAIIALVVSLIQIVDWSKFAKNALNKIAEGIQVIGPYAIAAAAGLALFYAPAILVGLAAVAKGFVLMGNAALIAGGKIALAWIMANPLTLLPLLAAVLAAVVVWATNASKPFRKFANIVIGIFKGLGLVIYGGLLSTFELINNAVLESTNDLITLVSEGLDKLPASIKKKLGISKIEFKFKTTNDGLKKMEEGLSLIKKSIKTFSDDKIEPEDFVGDIGKFVGDAIDGLVKQFKKWSAAIGTNSKQAAAFWKEIVDGANRTITTLHAEGKGLRMNSLDAAKLKIETQLLNKAREKGIKLTVLQKNKIKELSGEMVELEEANRNYREILEFNKSTFKSFISEMKGDLEKGKSLWESFGKAVNNVLDKMQDRFLDMAVDQMFDAMQGGKGGGGGIMGQAMDMFGGGSGGIMNQVMNMFGSGVPIPVAKPFKGGGSGVPIPVTRASTTAAVGGGGGFLSGIGDMFGGFFADGGDFDGGKPIMVGERGPEMILPRRGGSIVPNEGLGGTNVRIVMNINTPNADSFRQSQSQIVATMANQIEIAKKRNM